MYIGLHVNYRLLLLDFNETKFLDRYSDIKFDENPSVGAELFHADGQTDRHDEANSSFSRFCESAYQHRAIPTKL